MTIKSSKSEKRLLSSVDKTWR